MTERAAERGTFEYIEQKIRRDATGTEFGGDFEWLCKWFLQHAPAYRHELEKVWLWSEWPDRWSEAEKGIDLIARTRSGKLWAIQAKADSPDRSIPKREIDSFLSESNRSEFDYRLLIATTDGIGRNARHAIEGQEKPVGLVLRGDLLTAQLSWPTMIGGRPRPLKRWTPKPHQRTAVRDAVKGFQNHDRGRLIMACGTGKTLTAMWIAEKLQSRRTLVLVPSLSLVAQNLSEWGQHCSDDFDFLVVCSDKTVVRRGDDPAVQHTSDLGVPVTTDTSEIRQFLGKRRKDKSAVVFATYQSSDRVAAAQQGRSPHFDLAICDEAHRCAGRADGLFSTVLDPRKIKARKRLFMTATPRYIKELVKKRAAHLDYELVSMDDFDVFGSEFHQLSFHDAITADPPLLTDYQVVVIGVTNAEARRTAEQADLVRTDRGLETDARTLAAQIGLAKAIRKYNLKRIITFHSSVRKAARFSDPNVADSLPGVVPTLSRASRPSGQLWSWHVSGETPAGKRTTLLKELEDLPERSRGLISNCACLGEGVDVPALDGIAFIDPRRSMVDIIQAVGRVMRKPADGSKEIGTVVIPVFIDESEDADIVLSQSAFEPVWQVLRALRAHDQQLADELDSIRLNLGGLRASAGKVQLPRKIKLDVPRLLMEGFEQAFYVRTVERSTTRQFLPFEEAREFVRPLGIRLHHEWLRYCKDELPDHDPKPDNIPASPPSVYKDQGWISWADWLGTGYVHRRSRKYLSIGEAREFVLSLGITSKEEWLRYCKGTVPGHEPKPESIPANPRGVYKDREWVSWGDWLGTGYVRPRDREFLPFEEAREFVHPLSIKSYGEWQRYCKGELPGYQPKPENIPADPRGAYQNQGWDNWSDWLGTGYIATYDREYLPFGEARALVHALGIKSRGGWFRYCKGTLPGHDPKPDNIPAAPEQVYKDQGWISWGDWLGTGYIRGREYLPFRMARAFVRPLGINSKDEWSLYYKGELPGHAPKPDNIPAVPSRAYKDRGWAGWGDWLGTGNVANQDREFLSFEEARAFVHPLGIKSSNEWRRYCKGALPGHDPRPENIPAVPARTYKDQGWAGWRDWLGTGS